MSAELKKLQTEQKTLDRQISVLEKDIAAKRLKISEIAKQIHLLTKSELIVSEHAILRLLERRFGQEEMIIKVVEQVKAEIEPKLVARNCKINLDGGLTAIIENNVLITVR